MLLTGIAIYKPTQLHWLTSALGGYEMTRWLHFWTTMAFLAFSVVHVAQVEKAEILRVNGIFALKKELKLESYRLQVIGVKDAKHHPRYSPDVTAWDYQCLGKSHEDEVTTQRWTQRTKPPSR